MPLRFQSSEHISSILYLVLTQSVLWTLEFSKAVWPQLGPFVPLAHCPETYVHPLLILQLFWSYIYVLYDYTSIHQFEYQLRQTPIVFDTPLACLGQIPWWSSHSQTPQVCSPSSSAVIIAIWLLLECTSVSDLLWPPGPELQQGHST